MKCTAAQAVAAMEYYIGYCEKASSAYAQSRDKSCFTKNKGSNNYTYFGYICGVQGQPWCASTDTVAILDACGGVKSDAKTVLWGVYPYINCAQVWDAAPSSKKFRKGKGTPKAGDIIVFTDDGIYRTHTGMVYAVDGTYVYTIEGNSSNMCRKRSYKLTSDYIYGYVRPNYAEAPDPVIVSEKYGKAIEMNLHELSKGCAGAEVRTLQILLNFDIAAGLDVDGEFGKATKEAVVSYQKKHGLDADGVVGEKTWGKLLKGDE